MIGMFGIGISREELIGVAIDCIIATLENNEEPISKSIEMLNQLKDAVCGNVEEEEEDNEEEDDCWDDEEDNDDYDDDEDWLW